MPNALVAKGQTINLPAGHFNRIYVLAASANGDQKAVFQVGGTKTELNVQDWGGFIGQWDNRQWSSVDLANDHYGDMTGLKPGFIKRADLAWYCSHHHDAAGKNVDYSYSYLFAICDRCSCRRKDDNTAQQSECSHSCDLAGRRESNSDAGAPAL